MIGMMTSPTSEFTIAPKAAPMMTPIARSTTLPFIANSRNSFSTLEPSVRSPGEECAMRTKSIDQAGMHHVAEHGGVLARQLVEILAHRGALLRHPHHAGGRVLDACDVLQLE